MHANYNSPTSKIKNSNCVYAPRAKCEQYFYFSLLFTPMAYPLGPRTGGLKSTLAKA